MVAICLHERTNGKLRTGGTDRFILLIFCHSFDCISVFNTRLLNLFYERHKMSDLANTSLYEPSKVPFSLCADRHAVLPALSPLPISLMFFSHNKSGPDFLKQTMLWGLSPPITLCQFQSGLKYDSTVCASPCSKSSPPPPFPLACPFSLWYPFLRPCKALTLLSWPIQQSFSQCSY